MLRDGTHGQHGTALTAVKAWLPPEGDPYAAVDFDNASRIGALIALLVALVEAVALALDGADRAIEVVAAAALILIPTAIGGLILATNRLLDPTRLLALTWGGTLQIAALALLVDARLVVRVGIFWLLFAAAVHPLRRLVPLVLVAVAAAVALLVGRGDVDSLVMDLLLCIGLTTAAYVLLHALRVQRVALRDDHAQAVALSQVDPLTGLGNRRALDEALERETARSGRSGAAFAVAVIDIDDFKAINDRFGHLEGDRCLVEVARTIQRTVRRPDACFRWGGDEFVVLLPESDKRDALKLLGRLQPALLAAARSPDGEPVHASAAVASSDDAPQSEVLAAADRALLERKQHASVERTSSVV